MLAWCEDVVSPQSNRWSPPALRLRNSSSREGYCTEERVTAWLRYTKLEGRREAGERQLCAREQLPLLCSLPTHARRSREGSLERVPPRAGGAANRQSSDGGVVGKLLKMQSTRTQVLSRDIAFYTHHRWHLPTRRGGASSGPIAGYRQQRCSAARGSATCPPGCPCSWPSDACTSWAAHTSSLPPPNTHPRTPAHVSNPNIVCLQLYGSRPTG
jgi:hypothetical protein